MAQSTPEKIKLRRSKPSESEQEFYDRLMNESIALENELELQSVEVEKARKEKAGWSKKVQDEYEYQVSLKQKIEYLKGQYKLLVMANHANKQVMEKLRSDTNLLEEKVKEIENIVANTDTSKNTDIVHNNFPDLVLQMQGCFLNAVKEKAVLLNTIQRLIKHTQENEFNGFEWKARVAKKHGPNGPSLAARIRFDGVFMHKNDVREIYESVFKNLLNQFKSSQLSINLKMKKAINTPQMISTIDIILAVPLIEEKTLGQESGH